VVKQVNPLDALGESVAFGRFVDESLTWDDKWSAFPQKRYVEEAEKYSKPGSVAQKKAFFEAHYKRIAAMKAENDEPEEGEICNSKSLDLQTMMETSSMKNESLNHVKDTESQIEISHEIPEIEKPLLDVEMDVQQEPVVSCLNSIESEDVSKDLCLPTPAVTESESSSLLKENFPIPTVKVCPVESANENKSSPKSLRTLFSSSPNREPEQENVPVAKAVGISTVATDSSSKTQNPTKVLVSDVKKDPSKTTLSSTRRTKTLSASGSKKSRSKWHVFLALFNKSLRACRKRLCYPVSSSSKKEENDSRKKQKFEEKKFNDKDTIESELKTKFKRVETEAKKLRKSLFSDKEKHPEFYNERSSFKNKQIPKSPKL
jgi:hypothetical protein